MAGIRIAGLWLKKTEQGKEYHEGTWGNAIVRLYTNDYKKNERDPDLVIYLSEKPKEGQYKKPQAQASRPQPPTSPPPNQAPRVPPHKRPYVDHTAPPQQDSPWPTDEDIPF